MTRSITNNFAPWRVDYWFGISWLVSGMAGSWWFVFCEHRLFAVGVAFWFTVRGLSRVSRGLARERGIAIERAAILKLESTVVPGYVFLRADVPMMSCGICYGNVDLVISPVWSTVSFVVEIKSFSGIVRRWFGLCRLGKFYRLWSPQKQVRQQCRYLGRKWHFPVLWLPESKLNNWFVVGGILVVNGDPNLLLDGLRGFDSVIRKPVRVTFPYAPGHEITKFLRSRGFFYDRARFCWYGSANNEFAWDLNNYLSSVNGCVEWVQRAN